ncbi:MAG: hypothetical protein GY842_16575, partial [bacterium]|nr:hypothetical protein [bacterium]
MNTLVFAEMQADRLRGTALSAIRFAQEIAEQTGGSWSAAVIGNQAVDEVAGRVASFGPAKVFTVTGEAFG